MKKTLVIHPTDPTTDFLKPIYVGRGFTEVRTDFQSDQLKAQIKNHDRVIMLGHGYHHGLLHYIKPVIDDSFVPLLNQKELVGIWCFAKSFFDAHGLTGFHTDMFISEMQEAQVMGVEASLAEIDASNELFANAVRKNLFHAKCLERVSEIYGKITTPVARYNGIRLHHRKVGDPIIQCNTPNLQKYLADMTLCNDIIKNFFSSTK